MKYAKSHNPRQIQGFFGLATPWLVRGRRRQRPGSTQDGRAETQNGALAVFRLDLEGLGDAVVVFFEVHLTDMIDGMSHMLLRIHSQNDGHGPALLPHIGHHPVEQEVSAFSLGAEVLAEVFDDREPAVVLAAELVEKALPFLSCYFSRLHVSSVSWLIMVSAEPTPDPAPSNRSRF